MGLKVFAIVWSILASVLMLKGQEAKAGHHIKLAVPIIHNLAMADDDGNLSGAIVSVLDVMEAETGRIVDLSILPFPRVVQMLRTSEADLGVFIETQERNKMAHRIHRLYHVNFVLVSLKKDNITDLSQLDGKVVGVSRRGIGAALAAGLKKTTIYKFSTPEPFLSALRFGKIDAFFTPDFRVVELFDKSNMAYEDFNMMIFEEGWHLALYASHGFKKNNREVYDVLTQMDLPKLKNFGSAILNQYYLQK